MTPFDIAIDVSDNNTITDWRAVYAAGIRIAFVKFMESPSSSYLSGPIQSIGAKDAGIAVIPYWFLRSCDPETAVAEFVRRTGLKRGMRCALDWEGRASQTCSAAVAEEIGARLSEIIEDDPIGYWGIPGSTPAAPTANMQKWDRWVPRYPVQGVNSFGALPNNIRANPERWVGPTLPKLWQYTAWGRVPGITGLVDRSVVFADSVEDAVAWASGSAGVAAPQHVVEQKPAPVQQAPVAPVAFPQSAKRIVPRRPAPVQQEDTDEEAERLTREANPDVFR